MDWILLLHISFITVWFGSLVALPQLYAAHCKAQTTDENKQLVALERSLFFMFLTPAATLGIVTGGWLLYSRGFVGGWLPLKLLFVALLVLLHIYASELSVKFEGGNKPFAPWFYHVLSFAPVLLALPILVLVVAKPF